MEAAVERMESLLCLKCASAIKAGSVHMSCDISGCMYRLCLECLSSRANLSCSIQEPELEVPLLPSVAGALQFQVVPVEKLGWCFIDCLLDQLRIHVSQQERRRTAFAMMMSTFVHYDIKKMDDAVLDSFAEEAYKVVQKQQAYADIMPLASGSKHIICTLDKLEGILLNDMSATRRYTTDVEIESFLAAGPWRIMMEQRNKDKTWHTSFIPSRHPDDTIADAGYALHLVRSPGDLFS